MNSSIFYMAGTDGSGEYVVIAHTNRGRVGYRLLGDGQTRVRVEPAGDSAAISLPACNGWKQPGDDNQQRFSLVVTSEQNRARAIRRGLEAIGATAPDGLHVNSEAPAWALALLAAPAPEPITAEVVSVEPTSFIEEELAAAPNQAEIVADAAKSLAAVATKLAEQLQQLHG